MEITGSSPSKPSTVDEVDEVTALGLADDPVYHK